MAEKFSLKDHLFNPSRIERLAAELEEANPGFAGQLFVSQVISKLPELELKQRISWIAQSLQAFLPADYPEALGWIVRALPAPCDPSLGDDDFGDFLYAPYAEFVASYGCTSEYLVLSMSALHEITQRFSVEYAIRPFLNRFPERTLKALSIWVGDSHYHVRRLCSEGTRPRLPWAQSVKLTPAQTLPLLDVLYDDGTRFVTRSVANHLNDLTKNHADSVVENLARWRERGQQRPAESDFIERHALRNLVKAGHPGALTFLGFAGADNLHIGELQVKNQRILMGEPLEFALSFRAQPTSGARLVVDYLIEFQNKRGRLESRKVFKWKNLDLAAGESVELSKTHPLRANMTTRTLYPGLHRLTVTINGIAVASTDFDLIQ